MNLKILLPTGVLFDGAVTRVIAEAENGSFCILPRHADFIAALVPGILCFYTAGAVQHEAEQFAAVDSGLLVKCAEQVCVSTFNAVLTDDLNLLKSIVTEQFSHLNEREKTAKTALARLEAGTLRRFMELDAVTHV